MKQPLPLKTPLMIGIVATFLLLLVGWLDYLTGDEAGFFLFYYIPLGLAAWYAGRNTALFYSIFAAIIWLTADYLGDHVYTSELIRYWNSFLRLASFALVSLLFAHLKKELDRAMQLNKDLTMALSEVRKLSGMLPICASCKKIRNDEGYWEQIEVYVRDHSEAEFSHGICPECAEKLYPDFYRKKNTDRSEPSAENKDPSPKDPA